MKKLGLRRSSLARPCRRFHPSDPNRRGQSADEDAAADMASSLSMRANDAAEISGHVLRGQRQRARADRPATYSTNGR